ncbi:pre-mRNA-processing factor 39 [Ambystoma mexicanum]|uniref:pre-mRNA-processing factor 39 n=1 Tax=Ambystoma mexicanum TaxID=8296 RepID=UPI0037E7FDF8
MQSTAMLNPSATEVRDNASSGMLSTEIPDIDKQYADFTAEIMDVIEMEQSSENSEANKDDPGEEAGEAAEEAGDESACEIPTPPPPLPPPEEQIPFPQEFSTYWKVVEANVQDFSGWTNLLQYVEQENHIVAARSAFDHFFSHYPYCYGYWKKYADLERRHNNVTQADEVYRRGLQAIPLSVDLWIHYVNFLTETLEPGGPETSSTIRLTFQHAVLAAGTDFRSDRLWEMYVNWESEQGNLKEVTLIYERLLNIPTQLYSHHFQRFRDHIQNNLPREYLTSERFIQLRKEIVSMTGHGAEETSLEDSSTTGLEELTDPAQLTTEIENMRHRIIEVNQEIFNHNEYEVSKRWNFEEGIKRPYFHVKPLEKAQLKNWREYLDFEIENGSHERVVVLFERCVICCALYEDFWIKYATYMEHHSAEGVRHVYCRACAIHLPKKPMVHLLWSAYEEQQGNLDEARRILKSFEESVEGLAMVRLRRVSLERRNGNLEEAERLLQEAITKAKTNNESSFYAIKLARHLFKVHGDLPKARKVLHEAIERDQENAKLYLNMLEIEYSGDLKENEGHILACFDRAVYGTLPVEMRITFSQRKVEFLEDFGSDVDRLLTAYDEHQKLLQEQEGVKRKAENGSDEPDEKKALLDDGSMLSTQMMSGDMQANQAAYNYNAWYQYNYQNSWNYPQYYTAPST